MSQNTMTLNPAENLTFIAKLVNNTLVITKGGIGQTLVKKNFLFEMLEGTAIVVDPVVPLKVTDVKIYSAVPKGKGNDQQWVKGSLLGTVPAGGNDQQFGSPPFLNVHVIPDSALLSSTLDKGSAVLGFGVDFVDTSNNKAHCWDPEVQNRGNQPIES